MIAYLRGSIKYKSSIPKKDNFVIMHSGNIGLSQDFSSILKAVNSIKYQSSFYLVFVGEGAGKELLEKEINCFSLKNILFLPYQPLDMLSFSLSMADLHVVSLKKGMAGAVVPSKVYGIMAAGRPYLAITDRESEPAQMALEFKCGLWAEAENPKEIAESINWAMDHPVELGEMGETGRRIAETKFDKNIVINEWFKLLENLKV